MAKKQTLHPVPTPGEQMTLLIRVLINLNICQLPTDNMDKFA